MLKTCLYQKSKHSKIKSKFKNHFMMIMASLLVKNVEKFELQRESYEKELKIHSNYRSIQITEI